MPVSVPAALLLRGHFPHAAGGKMHEHQHRSHEKSDGGHEQRFPYKEKCGHDGMRRSSGQKNQGNEVKQEAAFRRPAGEHESRGSEPRQAFLAAQPPASGMKGIPSGNRRYGIEIPDF
jgi:hypothetical protein